MKTKEVTLISGNKIIVSDEPIKVGDKVYCLQTCTAGGGVELRTKGKIYDTCPFSYKDDDMELKTWGYINNQGEEQYIHYPSEMMKVISNY